MDENDIAELLKEGKLSGGYKGHRYSVTAPPTQLGGVSKEFHESELLLKDATISEIQVKVADLTERLEGSDVQIADFEEKEALWVKKLADIEKTIKVRTKEIKKLRAKVKDTIPIEEHNDLMNARIKAHEDVVDDLEDAQAEAIKKLENEIGQLEKDFAECEDKLTDCE